MPNCARLWRVRSWLAGARGSSRHAGPGETRPWSWCLACGNMDGAGRTRWRKPSEKPKAGERGDKPPLPRIARFPFPCFAVM